MVSDSDLVARLREILRSSDLDTATASSIRRQLEEDFGVDLSEKKKFIREQIDTFLETLNKGDGQSWNVTENEDNENDTVEDDENENDGIKEEEEEDSETKESKGSDKTEKVRKRGGFAKLSSLSPQLQAVVGVPELARTEVVKKLWAYIRENNLQDPKNRKKIKCDEALRAVFHVNSIDMFQMNKALSKHIWPLTGENESVKQKEKSKDINDSGSEGDNGGEQEDDEEEVKKESNERSKKGRSAKVDEDVKKRGGGFTKLCSLSPQLQELVGVPELARTGVVKKLWAYIREKNLQDPKNKRNIICDESLRSIFDVDSIDMFQMNKALTKHIWAVREEDAPSNSSPKKKGTKQGREEGPDEPKQKEKRQKKVPHEPKKKEKQQKKADKRRIVCDKKLKEISEVDSFNGFTASKLLSLHFIKTEQ
ncbi:upstream activation factor subunit spp27 isoform X2 [Populus trichocarpa]|uniref:upstream activation factor subunit spp27 isoform X2 n=1 Tax=Populus trichocarpa TaxID=3694 RepID=UPI002278C7F4|nr:upstream activation factor subunit spp27 isoform X2 [Populus trichocarpa]